MILFLIEEMWILRVRIAIGRNLILITSKFIYLLTIKYKNWNRPG